MTNRPKFQDLDPWGLRVLERMGPSKLDEPETVSKSHAFPEWCLSRRAFLRVLSSGIALGTVSGMARRAFADTLDDRLVLFVMGVLQPASADDVMRFLDHLYAGEAGSMRPADLSPDTIEQVFARLQQRRLAVLADQNERRMSLTVDGNEALGVELRHLRDTTRLFLLRGPRMLTIPQSRERTRTGVGGDSLAPELRSRIESSTIPAQPSATPKVKLVWSMLNAVFDTGPVVFSRDSNFRLLSFDSLAALSRAGKGDRPTVKANDRGEDELTPQGLALCLGVSFELLMLIQRTRASHYRIFKLKKRSGGEREIQSPRIFLKVVQRFILDFLLADQDIPPSVHSFVPGGARSAITNGRAHVGRRFVAKLDIKDFFPSIKWPLVDATLVSRLPVTNETASLLTRLCCLQRGSLPQGAPTSPMLANLVMASFDESMSAKCNELDLTLTRYADDITISGESGRAVSLAVLEARRILRARPYEMRLNSKKSRIVGKGSRQLVTGVVVNEKALPPRELRRRVRAMFHQASLNPAARQENKNILKGYLSYFSSFPDFPATTLSDYEAILTQPN